MASDQEYADMLTTACLAEAYSCLALVTGKSLVLSVDAETTTNSINAEYSRTYLSDSLDAAYYHAYTGSVSFSPLSDAYYALSKHVQVNRYGT